MSQSTHVDGNALGASFTDVFGVDVTDHRGCCDECGTVSVMATLRVYRSAPGDVARCPACGRVMMVVVDTPTGTRVSFVALRWVEVPI
jgi:hypothetical protein